MLDVLAGLLSSISLYKSNYPTPDGTCIRNDIHAWLPPQTQRNERFGQERFPGLLTNLTRRIPAKSDFSASAMEPVTAGAPLSSRSETQASAKQ